MHTLYVFIAVSHSQSMRSIKFPLHTVVVSVDRSLSVQFKWNAITDKSVSYIHYIYYLLLFRGVSDIHFIYWLRTEHAVGLQQRKGGRWWCCRYYTAGLTPPKQHTKIVKSYCYAWLHCNCMQHTTVSFAILHGKRLRILSSNNSSRGWTSSSLI